MSEGKFGLSDLDLTDDLDVSMDNETYQDQSNPAPVAAGKYLATMLDLGYAKRKDGTPIKENDEFPIFRLNMIEIVDGLGEGVTRKVGLFQDVKTKPFTRPGGGVVSNLGDLARALGTDSWSGLSEGVSRLQEAYESNATFAAQYDWGIYDAAFLEAAFAQLKIAPKAADRDSDNADEKKLVGALYKAARVTGMRFFPVRADGGFSHVLPRQNVAFTNPVTNQQVVIEGDQRTFEAKLQITRYFPKAEFEAGRVVLGPSKVKPAALPVAA